jgi:hypothetical protein
VKIASRRRAESFALQMTFRDGVTRVQVQALMDAFNQRVANTPIHFGSTDHSLAPATIVKVDDVTTCKRDERMVVGEAGDVANAGSSMSCEPCPAGEEQPAVSHSSTSCQPVKEKSGASQNGKEGDEGDTVDNYILIIIVVLAVTILGVGLIVVFRSDEEPVVQPSGLRAIPPNGMHSTTFAGAGHLSHPAQSQQSLIVGQTAGSSEHKIYGDVPVYSEIQDDLPEETIYNIPFAADDKSMPSSYGRLENRGATSQVPVYGDDSYVSSSGAYGGDVYEPQQGSGAPSTTTASQATRPAARRAVTMFQNQDQPAAGRHHYSSTSGLQGSGSSSGTYGGDSYTYSVPATYGDDSYEGRQYLDVETTTDDVGHTYAQAHHTLTQRSTPSSSA